jgi:hypothetical protein
VDKKKKKKKTEGRRCCSKPAWNWVMIVMVVVHCMALYTHDSRTPLKVYDCLSMDNDRHIFFSGMGLGETALPWINVMVE